MYPGLDFRAYVGTLPGTVFDENENTKRSKQKTEKTNSLDVTHHEGKSQPESRTIFYDKLSGSQVEPWLYPRR